MNDRYLLEIGVFYDELWYSYFFRFKSQFHKDHTIFLLDNSSTFEEHFKMLMLFAGCGSFGIDWEYKYWKSASVNSIIEDNYSVSDIINVSTFLPFKQELKIDKQESGLITVDRSSVNSIIQGISFKVEKDLKEKKKMCV